jgi:hypothetical protein
MNVLIINAFSCENDDNANYNISQITTTNNFNTINSHSNSNQSHSQFSTKSKNLKKFQNFEKSIKDLLNKATHKSSTGKVNFDTRTASQSDLSYYITDQDNSHHHANIYNKQIDTPSNRNFDKVDIIFIDGDEKFLPWSNHGKPLRTLIKMALINNKHLFACGVAMQSLIFFLATNFAHDMNFINSNGEVKSIEDIEKIPKNFLQILKKYDYFLDYVTGDVYEYHTKSFCWTPIMNIGLHKLNLTEKFEYRGKFVLSPHKNVSTTISGKNFSKTERPIYPSNNTEIKVEIYKTFLNHWIVKNLSHEFLVNCTSTWFMHNFNLKSRLIQFKILAHSAKGPMIIDFGNCIGLSFHLINKPKYSENLKILENFIMHKVEELEKGGFAIDKMIKDIEEQRNKEKFNCKNYIIGDGGNNSQISHLSQSKDLSQSQSHFSHFSQSKNFEDKKINSLKNSTNNVEFVDKKLAEEFLIRYKKEIDSGIQYRKEISQKYKIKNDYYNNEDNCNPNCNQEIEKLNSNTNYQTTSLKNNKSRPLSNISSSHPIPHFNKREIKIVENNAISSRPVSSRAENKILPMNKPGSPFKPTNSFAFYLKSQGMNKDDKFLYNGEVIDTSPNYLESSGDLVNMNKLTDVIKKSELERKSQISMHNSMKTTISKDSKLNCNTGSTNFNSEVNSKEDNCNVFSIMFPYVSEEEFPRQIKPHIVGSGFDELRKGKEVIRVDLTRKVTSNYNKLFRKYEKDLNTFASKVIFCGIYKIFKKIFF